MFWIGRREVTMNCKEKTTLKLSSNVITKGMAHLIGLYLPMDLKSSEYKDNRLEDNLSDNQKLQLDKALFYAHEIRDDSVRYPEKEENFNKCKNCEYKDICF